MKVAKISSNQEDFVIGTVHSEGHAVWRDARAKPKRRVFVSRMVHRQDVVTTRGAPSRLSEEGSATFMVRVRGLKWFRVDAASVLHLATPCKK
jgi:hypothetical protein